MKKVIGIKNRMQGIRCLAASVIVLVLAMAARVRKEIGRASCRERVS